MRIGLLLVIAGCASAPEPRKSCLDPGAEKVQLLSKVPPSHAYYLVGTVVGEADPRDLVQAAAQADCDIKNRANTVGATLVKVDQVFPADDKQAGRPMILIRGRAYRAR